MKKINSQGFTLIEILISLAILATLGLMISQAISQGVKSKKKIQEQIDEVSRLRDAVKLMERDIQLAYHHLDWEKELQDLIKKKSQTNPQQNQQTTVPRPTDASKIPGGGDLGATAADEKREVPRLDPSTHFVGSDTELHFVTMNTSRMSRDSHQADFIEVGYSLRDCKSADGKTSSKCLWRRTSKDVDEDPTKGGDEMVLLENVTEFSLKYLGTGKQDWVKDWKSNSSSEPTVKNKFPLAVEITLATQKTINNMKGKKYSLQIVAAIHFPNNKEETTSSGSSSLGTSTSQPGGQNPAGTPGAGP